MKTLAIALAAVSLAACTGTNASEPTLAPAPAAPSTTTGPAVELLRIPASAGVDGFALVVTPPSGDAVERWGLCLARVADCYVPGGDARTRARCLATTDTAPTSGENVCPSTCRTAFERAFAASGDAEAAVDATYKQGDCVNGFRSVSEGALQKLKLTPHKLPTNLGGTP